MALSGIHHLALGTNNMREQLHFFTQVAGMKLVALFPMHGAGKTATHCFIEIGKDNYLSFIEMEGEKIEPIIGVSHARDVFGPVAGGAMQHLSFNIETQTELRNLRDRLRTNGYAVVGPVDHGMSHSIYVGAPEGILLEFSSSEGSPGLVPVEAWVDEKAAKRIGISPEELAAFQAPPEFDGKDGAVEQPKGDDMIYPTVIPKPMFEKVGYLNDEELAEALKLAPQEG